MQQEQQEQQPTGQQPPQYASSTSYDYAGAPPASSSVYGGGQQPPSYAYSAAPGPADYGGPAVGSVESGPKETGCTPAAWRRVFISPQGILRIVEWLFSVIAFASMADQSGWQNGGDSFKFLVAANVLAWLYVMAMFPVMLWDLYSSYNFLYISEVIGDGLFCLLTFIAGVVTAARCEDKINGTAICSNADKPKAAAAFSFLNCFAFGVSLFFAVRAFRNS